MSRDAALQLLGLDPSASPEAIESALNESWTLTRRLADTAATDAQREQFEARVRELEDAGRTLLDASFRLGPRDGASEPATNAIGTDSTNGAPPDGASEEDASSGSASPDAIPTDVRDVEESVALHEGQLLAGRYEVRETIGEGGMGAVYRAFDRIRDSDIAIKVMLPRLLDVRTVKERFLHEARLSSELAHPNIVNAYDVGSEGELLFLTMELLQGTTLRQTMLEFARHTEPFPVDRAVEIATSVCSALTYAHAHLIHRDVKPENVFVCDDGTVKLMDFGISRAAATTTITITGATVGTLKYMAPEQMQGVRDIDGRADEYSVARMLYEMLAGGACDDGSRPLNELRADVSANLAGVVRRGMELDRSLRYPTAREFGEALLAVGHEPTKPARRLTPLLIVALLMLVVFGVGLGSVFGGFGDAGARGGGEGAPGDGASGNGAAGNGAADDDGDRMAAARLRFEELRSEWDALQESSPVVLEGLVFPESSMEDAYGAAVRHETTAATSAWTTANEQLEASLATARERLATAARTEQEERRIEQEAAIAALGDRARTTALDEQNFALVRCSEGTFTMGSPASESGRDDDEARRRESVDEFWIGETEITQGQWEALMDTRPWQGMPNSTTDPQVAVTHVTWDDAVEFCRRLTDRERNEGHIPIGYSYRLPLEVEWEYACRAGTSTAYSFGNDVDVLARHAVFGRSPNGPGAHPSPVKSKLPNRWGLYDMHGNVWEWIATTLDDDGPRGFSRGGSWNFDAQRCRSANRSWSDPLQPQSNLGFRVVLARSTDE